MWPRFMDEARTKSNDIWAYLFNCKFKLKEAQHTYILNLHFWFLATSIRKDERIILQDNFFFFFLSLCNKFGHIISQNMVSQP